MSKLICIDASSKRLQSPKQFARVCNRVCQYAIEHASKNIIFNLFVNELSSHVVFAQSSPLVHVLKLENVQYINLCCNAITANNYLYSFFGDNETVIHKVILLQVRNIDRLQHYCRKCPNATSAMQAAHSEFFAKFAPLATVTSDVLTEDVKTISIDNLNCCK